MTSVFIICPVRNASEDVSRRLREYVQGLESQGYQVHWPPRDTVQDDPVGVGICRENGQALLAADEIHIWYDPASQGSVFDFGMFFMVSEVVAPRKRLVLINREDVPRTEGKSFQNVLLALAE